jgi:hypothetical protein
MFDATIQSAADTLRITRRQLEGIDKQFEKALQISKGLAGRSKGRIERAAKKMETKQSKREN